MDNELRMRNLMMFVRMNLPPTAEEIADRGPRDKGIPHLLQRELAARLFCSLTCVRECETKARLPGNRAIKENLAALVKEVERLDSKRRQARKPKPKPE